MLIFLACIGLLLLGYVLYSPFVEKQAGIDRHAVPPSRRLNDGVDYVPLHPLRAFLIQFINVAGIGPIFGPILGALYGPVALVWIVLGNIIGGAVHDYFSGVMSVKEDGKSLPEIARRYYNVVFKGVMLLFTSMLLFFVGVVFIMSPAGLLSNLTAFEGTLLGSNLFWVLVILGYYFVATMIPIDKIVARFYPFFGGMMILITVVMAAVLLVQAPHLPTVGGLFDYLTGHHAHELLEPNPDGLPIWPLLFLTITCGAISGFHSTQSPIVARCLTNERYARPVFYGAMVGEGMVACVWAIAGIAAFPGGYPELKAMLDIGGPGFVVNHIATSYLGVLGGLMTIIAVAIFPISSGDTAFRSLRLTIMDAFAIPQSTRNRLLIAVPVLSVAYLMTLLDFSLIWRYFAFSNMLLSTSVLWLATKYLLMRGSLHWIASLPAIVVTSICAAYILTNRIGFNLPTEYSPWIGAVTALICLLFVLRAQRHHRIDAAAGSTQKNA